jgi:hypothetical protein
VLVQKLCVGTDEFEPLAVELLDAEIGEVFYLRIFPRHDIRKVEGNFSGADAPRFRVLGEMFHLRRIEKRLRRHAAAQDAKSADFPAAFDDGGFQSGSRRRPRRRVTAAAAADDCHVKIKWAAFGFHANNMGE